MQSLARNCNVRHFALACASCSCITMRSWDCNSYLCRIDKELRTRPALPRGAGGPASIPDKSDTARTKKIRRLLTDQESRHALARVPRLAISQGQDGLYLICLTP